MYFGHFRPPKNYGDGIPYDDGIPKNDYDDGIPYDDGIQKKFARSRAGGGVTWLSPCERHYSIGTISHILVPKNAYGNKL